MQSSRLCISLCFFLFACTCIAPAFSSSAVSDSSPTVSATKLYSTLSFSTSYYTGGERLIGKLPQDTRYYNFERKYARLQIQKHSKTNATGVYDVSGYLFLQFPYWRGARAQGGVRFWLNGLWSERARQLVMVGTASWAIKGQPIVLDAFLDVNYTTTNNPTLYNGYVSGILSSMVSANDLGFFDPFSIFSFPTFREYNYSLLSQVRGESSSASDVRGNQWPSYEGDKYCWVVLGGSIVLELDYAEECGEDHHHCFPLGTEDGLIGSLPRLLLFTPIQCSANARKMMYMTTFQDSRYDQGFGINSTVIGEASWNDEKKELFGVACRLLDPLSRTANEVGDCTMRLSLRYTSIFTVRNGPKLVGQFRSTKHVHQSSYFREINLTKADGHGLIPLPDVRYEYTKLDKVRSSCTTKRPTKRGNTYPDVNSDNMRLALTAKNSRGQQISYVDALPLWVEYDLYQKKNAFSFMPESDGEAAEISKPTKTSHSNISYKISLSSSSELEFGSLFQKSLNWSTNANHEVEIIAEGVYDAETGYLCMVGCRKLEPYGKSSTYISMDCEILVTLQFAPLTGGRGGLINGSITSIRAKTDPLYFGELIVKSISYHLEQAALTLWRMDLEVAMVLISNTLVCIFVALQIFHVRRNPKVPSFISLFMLLILSVEPMIPLVLNFEDAHLKRYPVHEVIGNGGRFESNEVVVRLSSLVALLLQLRLLQLVWNAKRRDDNWSSSWFGERKSGFVLLLLYAVGGFLGLLLNYTSKERVLQVKFNHVAREAFSVLGGLRPYSGLIVDGFLLPQILLNAFRGSAEKETLSNYFYVGISTVRVAPHAYSLYRLHNYPAFDLKKTYYYANLDVGFYSRVWDIVIPFGIILLALIIFLQQRRCGCCPVFLIDY